MILEIFCTGPALTNSILLGCLKTKKAAIIDAPFESSDILLKRIKELKLEIEMILLTHSHWDHIGEAALLKEKFNAPLYVHKEDAGNLKKPGSDGLPLFLNVQGVEPDHFLEDKERILLGELVIEVIHTPGHTPGGVCFYIPEEKILISGDTLFRKSIGNLSFSTANAEKMWKSLDKLAKLPPETIVIPGHGEKTTIGDESWLPRAKEYFGG